MAQELDNSPPRLLRCSEDTMRRLADSGALPSLARPTARGFSNVLRSSARRAIQRRREQ
jgi:hypothetical protein